MGISEVSNDNVESLCLFGRRVLAQPSPDREARPTMNRRVVEGGTTDPDRILIRSLAAVPAPFIAYHICPEDPLTRVLSLVFRTAVDLVKMLYILRTVCPFNPSTKCLQSQDPRVSTQTTAYRGSFASR